MANITVSGISDSLKRVYADDVKDYHLNMEAEFLAELQKVKKLKPRGRSFEWPFWLQSPQNIRTPAESGSIGTHTVGTYATGILNSGQITSKFAISWIAESAGQGEGSYDKDAVKRASWECVKDVNKHANRLFAGTHGTGRIGQVQTTIAGSTTMVLKLPIGVLLVRPHMIIDVYDAETGGSQEINSIEITKVAPATRTVTIASSSATADSHVYIEDSRTNSTVPNGIAGLVDDGTNATSVHGVSRSTYEELKSTVLTNGGVLRDLSEDLLVRAASLTFQKSGQMIDCLLMNTGQQEAYLRFVRPDRRRSFDGKGAVGHDTGYPEKLNFVYGGRNCPIYVSTDVSPRTVYGLSKSQIRFFELEKQGFRDWGGSIFQQDISTTYQTASVATYWWPVNFGTYMPAAHFRIDDLTDPQLCGVDVAGTDAYLS